jgi:hypothetical protein
MRLREWMQPPENQNVKPIFTPLPKNTSLATRRKHEFLSRTRIEKFGIQRELNVK